MLQSDSILDLNANSIVHLFTDCSHCVCSLFSWTCTLKAAKWKQYDTALIAVRTNKQLPPAHLEGSHIEVDILKIFTLVRGQIKLSDNAVTWRILLVHARLHAVDKLTWRHSFMEDPRVTSIICDECFSWAWFVFAMDNTSMFFAHTDVE